LKENHLIISQGCAPGKYEYKYNSSSTTLARTDVVGWNAQMELKVQQGKSAKGLSPGDFVLATLADPPQGSSLSRAERNKEGLLRLKHCGTEEERDRDINDNEKLFELHIHPVDTEEPDSWDWGLLKRKLAEAKWCKQLLKCENGTLTHPVSNTLPSPSGPALGNYVFKKVETVRWF
jgi:hypothetical protein